MTEYITFYNVALCWVILGLLLSLFSIRYSRDYSLWSTVGFILFAVCFAPIVAIAVFIICCGEAIDFLKNTTVEDTTIFKKKRNP